MRDPHVVSLHYRIVTSENVTYANPPALEWQTATCLIRLEDGFANIEMLQHCSSEQAAKEAVRPYLRAWEIETALRPGSNGLGFEFERSEIVDRNPPPPPAEQGSGNAVIQASVALITVTGFAPHVHVTQPKYPDPPQGFVVSPDVETMWNRYEGYQRAREPLASMAYFCLSVLQFRAGGRRKAARHYGIDVDVLDKLGELSSDIGDEKTARKLEQRSYLRAHTTVEIDWVESVVKRLIHRVGEREADPNATLSQMTLADFPTV